MARRLLLVWLVSVLVLTLAPFAPLRAEPKAFGWADPFASRLGLFDVVANLLLFAPLGIYGVQAGLRRRVVLGLACALSLSIETLQMWTPLRHPHGLDVLANVAGAGLGARFSPALVRLGRRLWQPPVRLALLAAGAATALALAGRVPEIARFTVCFPFAVAVLAGLVASGMWRPPVAFAFSAGCVALVCAGIFWPAEPLWLAVSAGGSALGAWPADQTSS